MTGLRKLDHQLSCLPAVSPSICAVYTEQVQVLKIPCSLRPNFLPSQLPPHPFKPTPDLQDSAQESSTPPSFPDSPSPPGSEDPLPGGNKPGQPQYFPQRSLQPLLEAACCLSVFSFRQQLYSVVSHLQYHAWYRQSSINGQ